MSKTKTTFPDEHRTGSDERIIDRLAKKLLTNALSNIQFGRLSLNDENETRVFGNGQELTASVRIIDPRFYSDIAFGGAIGAAEAYMRGYWTTDELTNVIRIFVRNRDALDTMEGGLAKLMAPLRKSLHWINRNTRTGSRRNIAAHYDLGNEFFELWLDESMMYSAAVFERPDMTLEEASAAKLERICRKLELAPQDHVLEIGTGWGGFAIYAAKHFGCRVTTTTISAAQHDYAMARVAEAGLGDRITLLRQDYRDLDGEYDKLVSIEMIEAVGQPYLDTYFEKCAKLLKQNGMMLLQSITIADQRYREALRSVDFIQRYIFPGGFLPSATALLESATAASDMRLYHLEDIGAHYAKTLHHWRERFAKNLNRIWSMGYGEEFLRMWHYYYCYCEGAFTERAIGNVQMLLVKPDCRREPLVPALRRA